MKPDADDASTTKAPMHGQGLRALVEARRRELELELLDVKNAGASGADTRADIEAALSALEGLMTGNLDQIPPVVAAELSQWLETSKYLGAKRRTPVWKS